MSAYSNLPPQAYTRETLSHAYLWMQTQPDNIKKMAQTPDALVSLYMRAQKFGPESLEVSAPVSSQSFKADLKNLAQDLKQFEEPTKRPAPSIPQPPTLPETPPPTYRSNDLDWSMLGTKCREMIAEVKSELNLSSDHEVLRLLISLGYKKIRGLYFSN